jgi:hypothetical protein
MALQVQEIDWCPGRPVTMPVSQLATKMWGFAHVVPMRKDLAIAVRLDQ